MVDQPYQLLSARAHASMHELEKKMINTEKYG